MSSDANQQDNILARIVQLSRTVLSAASMQEAATLIVNRIGEIVPMDQAILLHYTQKKPIMTATGGLSVAEDSRLADAVDEVIAKYSATLEPVVIQAVTTVGDKPASALETIQKSKQGTTIVWFPLVTTFGDEKVASGYALWLERWNKLPWQAEELALLEQLIPSFCQALQRTYRKAIPFSKKAIWTTVISVFVLAMLIPLRSSVVAPGRVMPDKPHYVFAPFDGILKDLLVEPGQLVKPGTVLFRYDPRVMDKHLDEANKAVETARAELFRLEGAGYQDPEAQSKLPVQRLEVGKAEADVKFYAEQRERGDVASQMDGVVVLDDPDSLIGASLQTGQSIMSIADPSKTKFRIMVPVADAGLLQLGAQVEVRLDKDPLTGLAAKVTHIGYDVKLSEEQVPSILVEAAWNSTSEAIAPGQRGTAKIYSEVTTLGLQLFRRPLIVLRQLTGL